METIHEREADARLIAAAPDMLEALRQAPCGCQCSVHNDTVVPTLWNSRKHGMITTDHCKRVYCARCAAIRKAEGLDRIGHNTEKRRGK